MTRNPHYVRRRLLHSWQLYAMLALPILWLIVFQYWPMWGAQIAFRNFLPGDGLATADWVGLKNFRRFFESAVFWQLLRNTLLLSFYSLVIGFPIPIIFALSLNQLRQGLFKQSVQLISYAPYFISTVVLVGMLLQFLDLRHGPINLLLMRLGLEPLHFMGQSDMFRSIYVWSGIWQFTGFSTVIYLAALSTIDTTLHEAAVVDGANRIQRIVNIDLPGIMPTAMTLLILNIGQLINVGFEKIYLMQNPLNTLVSEVISTYVYKIGLIGGITNYSYAAAIGMFNSVIGLILIVLANWLAKRLTQSSLW